jgi:zinc transport system ATP-binding protein
MSDIVAIKFENVTFGYTSVPVVENVNFTIRKGEFISIVGPNGGGKTTLLKMILGLLKPDKGVIKILGNNPGSMRKSIGYMPQSLQYDQQFPITVMDIVMMGRLGNRWGGPYSKSDRSAALKAMKTLGIENLAKRSLSEISGGQRQRVLIARTLACEPEILLLDEPTANVDADVEKALYDFLQNLDERLTVVMVSHDLAFVMKNVKCVICVNKTVVRHPTSEVTPEAIESLYKGEMRIVRHDKLFKNGES